MLQAPVVGLNESPSEKEGKSAFTALEGLDGFGLNESPSEKEGKYRSGEPTTGKP